MPKSIKLLLVLILLFSIYHLIRDVLQILDMHFVLTEIAHREHQWCSPYCDYVSIPLDIAGIGLSLLALAKKWHVQTILILGAILAAAWISAFLIG